MSGTLDSLAVEKIMKAVEELATDLGKRVAMSKVEMKMVDANGASRLAKKLIEGINIKTV